MTGAPEPIDPCRMCIKGYQEMLLLKERLNPPRLPQKEVRTVEVA